MFEARGTTKDGRAVKGWYFPANARSYIVRDEKALGPICWKPEFIEDLGFYIVEAEKPSIAFATGKLDMHDDMIYGSVPDEGFMGGDTLMDIKHGRSREVFWDKDIAGWVAKASDNCWVPLWVQIHEIVKKE